jgi:hypothetical protein
MFYNTEPRKEKLAQDKGVRKTKLACFSMVSLIFVSKAGLLEWNTL